MWGAKITWFQCEHRNWLGFCVGGRNWLGFCVCGRNWLDFSVGMKLIWLCGCSKMTRFHCGGTELTWFQCRDRKWLAFCLAVEKDLFLVYELKFTRFWCRGIEIHLTSDWGSKLTWFQRWGRNQLGFYAGYRTSLDFSLRIAIELVICGVQNDLVLVSESKLIWLLCRGINTDLNLEWGS